MVGRLYSLTERDLVYEWSGKWLDLIRLINNVTGTDQQAPYSIPPPTENEELEYQCLRFWLIDHETRFVPLWQEFYKSHDWVSSETNVDEAPDLPQRYCENHFLFFYEPENLYRLARQLELQSGIDIWEPAESVASQVRSLFIRLGQLMIEFIDWMDERVCD